MNASLVEMVLAIALAGLVFVGAIVPTTQSIVAYQEAEAELRFATAQASALVRAEQVAGSVWRDAEPPQGHAIPQAGQSGQLKVGDWSLRDQRGRFEQKGKKADWGVLAQPITRFSFRYQLADGSWQARVSRTELDGVLSTGVSLTAAAPALGAVFRNMMVAATCGPASELIELPETQRKALGELSKRFSTPVLVQAVGI